jgi:hypothetical protein
VHHDHKYRWVFGPVVEGKHAAGEYSLSCEFPYLFNGAGLAYCVMNAHQIAAARQDPRLIVLPSLHSTASVPDCVVDHHCEHGVTRGMTMHDFLVAMSVYHSNFEPED